MGKISNLDLQNKTLEITRNSRTSAGIGVPVDQLTSKNHNYFCIYRIEVIQKLKCSYGCLVSTKNIKKKKIQIHIHQYQICSNKGKVFLILPPMFSLLYPILDSLFISLTSLINKSPIYSQYKISSISHNHELNYSTN